MNLMKSYQSGSCVAVNGDLRFHQKDLH